MLSGFREFVMRGNVVDLAVGVVVGASFSALVTAFTHAFLTPLIKLATGGRGEVAGRFTVDGVVFDWGSFVTALISFLLTALVVYVFVVRPVNLIAARFRKPAAPPAPPEPSNEEKLLTEIRDELRRRPAGPL
ncbi:large conductance mechanosensitive channel protein MscL [Deinococcus petrolearius]|uniref:Large-conductance mechanosensitive channel n=1 Tax=Deinococcus petrolearius TaxID=1751295 RepID=A0ABW1DN51_9DEIO